MTYLKRGPIAAKTPKMHWLELSTDQTYSAAGVVALDTLTSSASGGVSLASNQITLTAGRHYILFGGWSLKRTGTITYVDVSAQWHDGTQFIGKKGSIRANSGNTNTSDTKIGLHRNPTYRREAVAFVDSSTIIGSQTYTLERISVVDGNAGGNWSYANASNCNAAVIIMSIPA